MSDGDNQSLTFREQVHHMLRASILDAARERATHTDWDGVRIADIAKDVGVSRQTIYNEFGTKQQLAETLFNREMQVFLDGIVGVCRSATDLESAMRNALDWMFSEARTHAMLQRMLSDAHEGSSTALLPLLTTNANVIVRPTRTLLAELFDERWPVPGRETERIADVVVRLSMSHVVLHSDFPQQHVVDDIVRAAMGMAESAVRVDA